MVTTETVFNAFINANIMLIFAYFLWSSTRYILKKFKTPLAYAMQLRLLNGIFLAIALSPIAVLALAAYTQMGLVAPNFSISISDFAVAQFLHGNIEIKAIEFEKILGLRETVTQNILSLNTPVSTFIVGLFVAGFSIFLTNSLLHIVKLRSILRSCYQWRQFGNVKLLLSDTTFVPFSTRGFKSRYVVIPSGMLANSTDLKIVLNHEFQHIRQGDVEWEFIQEALRPLFFWNPAFLLWKRQVQKLRELACDQVLISKKKLDALTYCECLLNVCSNSIRKDDRYSIALPVVPFVHIDQRPFGVSTQEFLKQRVIAIVEPTKRKRLSHKAFRMLLFPSMALVMLTSLALQEAADWSQDRLMLATIVNLERLEARNTMTP